MRPNRAGQIRAYLSGTRIRVQDIVSDYERHGLSPEQIVREYPHLTLAQVHAALSYYYEHGDEVREHIKADDEYVRQSMADVNSARRTSAGKDAHDDSLSA